MTDEQVTRAEFESLVRKVDENTTLTREVREILGAFKVLFWVAKWTAAVAAAVVAVMSLYKQLRGA